VLLVSKSPETVVVPHEGDRETLGARATVLAGDGAEPGFTRPKSRRIEEDGKLSLGPYAVAMQLYSGIKKTGCVGPCTIS
jgi:hypothetical protein